MILKPGKYNTNNLQVVFNSWKRHHSRSILDQAAYHFINSTAVFLQGNENAIMANIAAINNTDLKTIRNTFSFF